MLAAAEQPVAVVEIDGQPVALTPEDVQALQDAAEQAKAARLAEREERLNAVAQIVLRKRKHNIEGRRASGIEDDWREDQEFYDGIDDANRHEERQVTRKPMEGGGYTKKRSRRSTGFLNITRPYVDAAASRIGDMLMPTDESAFKIEPDKVPNAPAGVNPDGTPILMDAAQYALFEKRWRAEQSRKAKNVQEQIEDFLTESNYQGVMRNVIDDAARLGVGVVAGPLPVAKVRKRWQGNRRVEIHEVVPGSFHVDPWDFYPDPDCGEDIQRGEWAFWRRQISWADLSDLRDAESLGYFADQIDKCLDEGPQDNEDLNGRRKESVFTIWYGFGRLKIKDALDVLKAPDGMLDEYRQSDPGSYVSVMVFVVNDRVVRLTPNPTPNNEFPFDVLPWVRREGSWAGKGIARLGRPAQRAFLAATRKMFDNADLSSGLIFILKKAGLEPADGRWDIDGSNKAFLLNTSAAGASQVARDAIATAEIPSRTNELMSIAQFALKMMEDVTGLPALLQGQQGKAPDTVGGMTMLVNNGNGVLRRMARFADDYITDPHITRYSDWIQEYSQDPNMLGGFVVNARGSSALVERDIQNQWIVGMAQFVSNPEFKIAPHKWFEEFCRSVRFDPARVQYTDEEWEAKKAEPQQPPLPLQIEQMRGQSKVQAATVGAQAKLQAEQIAAESDARTAQIDGQARIQDMAAEVQARRETMMLEYALKRGITLDQVKADMAKAVMDDRRERDLFVSQAALKTRMGSGVDMPG